jgi:hypothetical protein
LLSDVEPNADRDVQPDAESDDSEASDNSATQNQDIRMNGGLHADAARRMDEAIDAVYQRCRGNLAGTNGTDGSELISELN